MTQRTVTLRHEVDGEDRRSLWAEMTAEGNLLISGQDLGPATGIVSPDGEYEWFKTIRAEHLPAFRELLGIRDHEDLLTALEDRWSGKHSHELEAKLRDETLPFPVEVQVWS